MACVRLNFMTDTVFHFIMPVWGENYTRLFHDVCLPSLLAPGNIPTVSGSHRCIFHIYTNTKGRWLLHKKSPAYERLAEQMRVVFHAIPDQPHKNPGLARVQADHFRLQSNCYRDALEYGSGDSVFIFLCADLVFADGCFRSLLRILEQGARAVMTLGLRLNQETVIPHFKNWLVEDRAQLAIPSFELVRLAMLNLHPIAENHFYSNLGGEMHPGDLYWRVKNKGLLAHSFNLHPIAIHPSVKGASFIVAVDGDYPAQAVPDIRDFHVVTDSEEFCLFELSPADKREGIRPRIAGVDDIVQWARIYTNAFQHRFFKVGVRLHTGVLNGAWSEIKREANQVVFEITGQLFVKGIIMRIQKWYHRLFGFRKCPTCLHWFYPRKSLPEIHAVVEDVVVRVKVCGKCAPFVDEAKARRLRFGS